MSNSAKTTLRTIKVSGVKSYLIDLQSTDSDNTITLSYTSYNALLDKLSDMEKIISNNTLKLNALEQYVLTHQLTYEIKNANGDLYQYISPNQSSD